MRHLLHRRGRLGRGFGSRGKSLSPADMMARAPQRDQRFDLGCLAMLDVGLTEIATVGEYPLGTTQFLRQRLDLLDHRQELLFVVGRLGVVTLIKATASNLHDA